jgi:hypothetical protein
MGVTGASDEGLKLGAEPRVTSHESDPSMAEGCGGDATRYDCDNVLRQAPMRRAPSQRRVTDGRANVAHMARIALRARRRPLSADRDS